MDFEEIYYDWSIRRGVVWSRVEDGYLGGTNDPPYDVAPRMSNLLDTVNGDPTSFRPEATFGSFYLPERFEFIWCCGEEGHEILTIPTRIMTRERYRQGFVQFDAKGKPKKTQSLVTDYEDIICMKAYYERGGHLKRPSVSEEIVNEFDLIKAVNRGIVLVKDSHFLTAQAELASHLMRLRSTGQMVKRPRSAGFYFVPEKDTMALQVNKEKLPDFNDDDAMLRWDLANTAKDPDRRILVAGGKDFIAAKEIDWDEGLRVQI